MANWLESVEIAERKKAREQRKQLDKWDAVSEISLQLQSKYNADGLFRFNFRAMSDADVLDWCKCAICWTDIYTIERLLHIEGGKIVGYENGEIRYTKDYLIAYGKAETYRQYFKKRLGITL